MAGLFPFWGSKIQMSRQKNDSCENRFSHRIRFLKAKGRKSRPSKIPVTWPSLFTFHYCKASPFCEPSGWRRAARPAIPERSIRWYSCWSYFRFLLHRHFRFRRHISNLPACCCTSASRPPRGSSTPPRLSTASLWSRPRWAISSPSRIWWELLLPRDLTWKL